MAYVNQIGDAQSPPPYSFPNAKILSFRIAADLEKLRKVCDELLNVGSLDDRGFEFRPIFPFVDVDIIDYPVMEYGFFRNLGYTSQHECCVRIFVMKYIAFGGWLFPDGEVAIFCPALLVDNPWSAFCGRDVLGYPKLMGQFDPIATPARPYTTVKTLAFRQGAPKAEVLPVIEIKPASHPAPSPPALKWPWGDFDVDQMPPWIQSLGSSLHFGGELFAGVQMKQFRDATNPFLACYRSIIQCSILVEQMELPQQLPATEITFLDRPGLIPEYRGFNLAASLGIPPNTPLRPMSQYHMTCTFSFTSGYTLFEEGPA